MKRRLIVMRHAKSSWTSGVSLDHDRPLNDRGKRDSPRIAARLRKLGWEPELVLCSTSARTQETWSRMADAFDDVPVMLSRELYHGDVGSFLTVVAGTADEVRSVLVLGHNPGWEHVVEWLTGHSVRMTTANAALLEHDAPTWDDALRHDAWHLDTVLRPKEL